MTFWPDAARLRRVRRHVLESLRLDSYSHPSLFDLDRKLERYLDFDNGFFIEAGANDGFDQSNTYYLERFRKWRGILIEPVPELFRMCLRERPRAKVFNCALVPFDYGSPSIDIWCADLMSLVPGARKTMEADAEHLRRAELVQTDVEARKQVVPARTLSSILDEVGVSRVDLLSLDVEGFELSVLRGLDLSRHLPSYMLVEVNFRADIEEYIGELYETVEDLSPHDVLYRLKEDLPTARQK